ncbi:MAG: ATP-binding protein [Mucilaginibacter sp.]|uniref:DNA polymerase III subunit n=1 Tax=Mucilaginibacter sp. TaxID=1882438 RepID=UPI0034E6036B
MQFKEIVGQETIKQKLLTTVKENRVSHAQLFLGPEGSGSLALAVAYAQYISCENKSDEDSCGECNSCRKYQKLVHPDLHFSYPFFAKHKDDTALTFIDQWRKAFLHNPYLNLHEWRTYLEAENKQANINIAECHQIIRKLSFKPFESEYKILIMWLPEYLDKEGNTLLKIIEEPAQKTLFLLVAESQDDILNTILSRTQLVKIPALKDADVQAYLEQHHQTEHLAAQIAYLSNGNLTAALHMISRDDSSYHELFARWLRLCFTNDGLKLIEFTETLAKLGRENQKNFLQYGMCFIRECGMLLSGAGSLVHLPEKELVVAQNMAAKVLTLAMVEVIADELDKAHYHVERNANPRILFLDVSLQLVKILKFKTFPQGTQHILY